MKNKFKFVIPSYNNEEFVEYNLASILNQTYQNYEVLYIDDASTDNTYNRVVEIISNDNRFKVVKREENKGAAYNYFFELEDYLNNDEDIIIHLDGDDWLYDENVLNNLNDFYNDKDVWMTYGKFYCYSEGDSVIEAFPQNTPHPDYVKRNKLYRRDIWRASHLRTYKTFLFKALDKEDLYSKIDGKLFWHALDLAFQYPYMEMSSPNKIGVVDFPTCVYNQAPKNAERTQIREHKDNSKFEDEIRNKKVYKSGLSGEKLPQINVYYDYLEYMHNTRDFTYCYKQEIGDYDMVLIGDWEIPNYTSGKINIKQNVPVIARLFEHRSYFNNEIYNNILENYDKFDLILTHDKKLLEKIDNTQFCPAADVITFNRLPNPNGLPPFNAPEFEGYELPNDIFQIYAKNKLVSTVASNKAFLPGHVKRLEFLKNVKDKIDVFGTCQLALFGYENRKSISKFEALKDYAFSIAIENQSHELDDYYFSEKIVDCFITGTVPIYYGCPNIGKFYDIKGILTFTNIEELHKILDSLSMDLYYSMIDSIKYNFEKSLKYNLTNDHMYKNFYKDILENLDNCKKNKKLY
jgi:glycosyltransferase involved in cell wall biosynthesis